MKLPFLLRTLPLALLGTSLATAQEEDVFFSDLPIVATVSRLPQRQADAPTAVTVIDRDMIRASGARDLNDVFRLVPGFQTYPNNTDAARVTYHGITDEEYSPRVQVLIDGRSQYSPLFKGGVNWATLPVALEDIERIEVVRGSNTPSYGSNAFLGVINIITTDPALVKGVSVSVNHGSQNVRDYTLRGGTRLGEAGHLRLTYQQKDDDGLTNQFDWIDQNRSRLFDLRADLQLSDRDVLHVGAGHIEAVSPRGRLAKKDNTLTGGSDPGWPIHESSEASNYLQLLWRRSLAADADLQVRYAYTADWASDRYVSLERKRFNGVRSYYLYEQDGLGNQGTRHELEVQHTFSPFDKTRLVWGGSLRRDGVQSDHLYEDTDWVNRHVERVFGNLEWRPVRFFTGNAGLSLERDSLAGNHAAPRVSGNFHLTPQNTVRVGWSRAWRTGSAFDYRGYEHVAPFARQDGQAFAPGERAGVSSVEFIGDPDMSSERMDTWELGYLGDWRDWRMSLDVRLFQENIPNRLLRVFVPSNDGADQTTEVQKIRIEGLEYQWRWQPFSTTRLMLAQSFTHIYGDFLDKALAPGAALSSFQPGSDTLSNLDDMADRSAPRYATSFLWMQKLPLGLEASMAGYWLDKMKWTRNSWQEKYSRVDARVAYPFRWGTHGGEVAYTVQSINGGHGEFKHSEQPADRIVDRRYWLTLRLDY